MAATGGGCAVFLATRKKLSIYQQARGKRAGRLSLSHHYGRSVGKPSGASCWLFTAFSEFALWHIHFEKQLNGFRCSHFWVSKRFAFEII